MPAAPPALLPPTSPYLQALERASKGSHHYGGNKRASEDDIDGEGDVCWVCGNATRASQAYCSNTCRDEDNGLQLIPVQEIEDPNDQIDALQLSPAVNAVPALIPSGGGSGTNSRSANNSSGNTTPHASRRSSANAVNSSSINALTGMDTTNRHTQTRRRSGGNSTDSKKNNQKNSTTNDNTASSGTASSSSPPSSSATSSPAMRTSADEDVNHHNGQPHVEDDIEGLLLPPPAVIGNGTGNTSPNKKHQQHQHFDYAYPYAIRPNSSGLIIPKSPPPLHVARTQLPSTGVGAPATSTGMRKSSSQQHNRHSSNGQNKMLSPVFGPKSVGSSLHPEAIRPNTGSSTHSNTSNGGKNTQHDNTNTPPLKASEVITFRRRHYATDSLNGHQKASHGRESAGAGSSAATSSSNSPALKATQASANAHASSSSTVTTNASTTNTTTTNSSSSNSSSRRHSSHASSSGLTSPNMLPAFSPLVKARSITNKSSIPTLNTLNGVNATQSPKLKAVDSTQSALESVSAAPNMGQNRQHHGLSSPSLAASSLSNLLHRTTSKGDPSSSVASTAAASAAIAGNRRASKSDSLLTGSAMASSSSNNNNTHQLKSSGVPATSQGLQSTTSSSNNASAKEGNNGNKASWLQRNKLTKNFFSFNGPLASSSLTGRIADAASTTQAQASSPPPPHAAHATCGRKNCPVNHATHPLASFFTPLSRRSSEPGSPFASPAIYYSDNLDPFEESFSKSASDSITTTGLKNSITSNGTIDGVAARRRPSLGTSNTAPPVITTPSPGVNGVKPQDYSGFAGFLFALHNQRKGTAASVSSPLSPNGAATATTTKEKDASRKAMFDVYSTPESSESGYDAQDEDQARLDSSTIRGRGRSTRRQAVKEIDQSETAKNTLLKEKSNNVVRASNDRSNANTLLPAEVTPAASDVSPARSHGGNGGKPRGFLFSRGNAFKNSSISPAPANEVTSSENIANEVSAAPSQQKKLKEDIQIEAVNFRDNDNKTIGQQEIEASGRGRKAAPAPVAPRAKHNHSTSVGEGSQYIINLRGSEDQKAKKSIRPETGDDSSEELTLSDGRDSPSRSPERSGAAHQTQQRGRPTARRRSSANGRMPVVSPFTTLERANTFANGEEKQQQLQTEDGGRGRSRARGSAALQRSVSPARSSSRARGRDSPRLRTR